MALVGFTLTCESSCSVHFEPEGADHRLEKGDRFWIELSTEPDYFEVTHSPDAIVIWVQGAEVKACNKTGEELRL